MINKIPNNYLLNKNGIFLWNSWNVNDYVSYKPTINFDGLIYMVWILITLIAFIVVRLFILHSSTHSALPSTSSLVLQTLSVLFTGS